MDEERRSTDEVDARLASLAQFGFPHDEMVEFLAEHEGGTHERLAWLEEDPIRPGARARRARHFSWHAS